jgi:hypothetical protein
MNRDTFDTIRDLQRTYALALDPLHLGRAFVRASAVLESLG